MQEDNVAAVALFGLVELSLDRAGVVERLSGQDCGFFIADAHSGVVISFQCEDALVTVHDTSQLRIGPTNAQDRAPDIQFEGGRYTETPASTTSEVGLLQRVAGQPDELFPNLAVLADAAAAGAFKLPPNLREAAMHYRVGRFLHRRPIGDEVELQRRAYERLFDTSSAD